MRSRKTHRSWAALAPALLLAACGSGREEAPAPEPTPAEREMVPTATIPPPPAPAPDPAPANRTAAVIPGEQGERMETMPLAMHGVWAGEGTRCARSSDLRLEIARDRLTFYESVAKPVAITRGAGQSIEAELELSGEGETWRERQTFTLSEGGRRLVRSMADGRSVTYARCNSEEDL
ncbi:hypothetical protein [Sphingomonas sp.]